MMKGLNGNRVTEEKIKTRECVKIIERTLENTDMWIALRHVELKPVEIVDM